MSLTSSKEEELSYINSGGVSLFDGILWFLIGDFSHTYSNDALCSLWYFTPSISEIQFICSVMLLQRREPRATNGHSGVKNLVIKGLSVLKLLPWAPQ